MSLSLSPPRDGLGANYTNALLTSGDLAPACDSDDPESAAKESVIKL